VPIPKPQRWTLTSLNVRWLPAPRPRYNTGISFDCPTDRRHRHVIRFLNPYDGDPPITGPGPLAEVVSRGGVAGLTLRAANGVHALDFGDCGGFCVINGEVEECN